MASTTLGEVARPHLLRSERASGGRDPLELALGLAAAFEEWRKWSPRPGDPVSPSVDTPWIDIEKAILTRTVSTDREVVGPASHVDDTLSGCDVEIVAGVEAWSFAFEDFGRTKHRRRAVRSAWEMLIDTSGPPDRPVQVQPSSLEAGS